MADRGTLRSSPLRAGRPGTTEAFSTASHLAYSGFTHIDEIEALKFAVGLREHTDVDAVVAKLLPMCVNVPGVVKKRVIRSPPRIVVDPNEDCEKLECVAVRTRIRELEHANDELKREVANLETGLKTTTNKISNAERAIKVAEENKAQLQLQLDEIRGKTSALELDASEVERSKKLLQDEIAFLERSITAVNEQIQLKASEKNQVQSSITDERVTFGDPLAHEEGYSVEEERCVRRLVDVEDPWPTPRA